MTLLFLDDSLALAAILSNHLSELAIAEWGAGQSEAIQKALGFEKGMTLDERLVVTGLSGWGGREQNHSPKREKECGD